MRELTTGNGLTMIVEGDGAATSRPPILFVHGMFGGAWYWEKFQCYFAERGYASVAVNLRGHHGSRPVPDIGNVSVLDYVDDVLSVARAGGPPPIVVGHSMGGLIAQKVAEAGAAAAVVLLASAPCTGISVFSLRLLTLTRRFALPVLRSRALYPEPRDADSLVFNHIPPAGRPALFDHFAPESGRAAREMLFSEIAVDETKVQCPVLSVSATDDHMVPPRVGLRLARKYHAPYEEIPNQGHFLVWEPGWETVAAHVGCWLDRVMLDAR